MSMNLCFRTKKSGYYIDMPCGYETQSDTTFAVIKAKTIKEKIKLLNDEMIAKNVPTNAREEIVGNFRKMLLDKSIKLGFI